MGKTNKTYQKILGGKRLLAVFFLLFSFSALGQQDPQFTQYMYNTLSVNPAYAGSRGHLTSLLMHRSQWVGINGAPNTQVLSMDSPVENNIGAGLVFANDVLGPASEFFVDGNVSYTIQLDSVNRRLSFGLKVGGRLFNVDFSKGLMEDPDVAFQDNIANKFFPTLGAGLYYHTGKAYLGFAVPNFFSQNHYDGEEQEIAAERLHYYLIGGKIIDMTPEIKFKPAFFVKWVPGAPIIADISANALLKETFTFGLSYRWDDSFSALLGLQISPELSAGYAYDLTTTNLGSYTSGTHEIFLRYEFKTVEKKLKSPRFY
ncbi:type IX secretion system membrane protein PorP/SprF [Muricauda sp. JGD-17]|uniref:Type IX secretion system membrane protein PorP/SprF n=1 Tax=Flagellimonas ochracea TaxID=2696472 RepID=A0A964TD38_9FLAO|nr:type IX secretion system membrane protein PorP/SprF [Allomuricauda ochracea]NAY92642.1 type IX secretion system membrane protein PorP/SprF [Allomuricauda ochracea]